MLQKVVLDSHAAHLLKRIVPDTCLSGVLSRVLQFLFLLFVKKLCLLNYLLGHFNGYVVFVHYFIFSLKIEFLTLIIYRKR
jgi:hypothetical protein